MKSLAHLLAAAIDLALVTTLGSVGLVLIAVTDQPEGELDDEDSPLTWDELKQAPVLTLGIDLDDIERLRVAEDVVGLVAR